MSTDYLNILSEDAFSGDELDFMGSPVMGDVDGSPTFSMERWVRIVLEPPFVEIQGIWFWVPSLVPPAGWELLMGVAPTYRQPVAAPSAIATTPVPITRPSEPNLKGSLQGSGEQVTEWIVLQAVVDADAPTGPLLGFDPDGRPNPLQYQLDWVEIV